jgi:XrtJ-associated TM-motif-TM protein
MQNALKVIVGVMSLWVLAQAAQAVPILTGCVNSPENPTLVLGVLGVTAAGLPKLKRWIAKIRS